MMIVYSSLWQSLWQTNTMNANPFIDRHKYIRDVMEIEICVENYAIAICLAQQISYYRQTISFRINNFPGNAGTLR